MSVPTDSSPNMSQMSRKIKMNPQKITNPNEVKENATYLHQNQHLSHVGSVHQNDSNENPHPALNGMNRELDRITQAVALEKKVDPRTVDLLSRSIPGHMSGAQSARRIETADERDTGAGHTTGSLQRHENWSLNQDSLNKYSTKRWYDAGPISEQPWTPAMTRQSNPSQISSRNQGLFPHGPTAMNAVEDGRLRVRRTEGPRRGS